VPERVAAAVVTYNRAALLVECLRALLGQTHPVDRVVLVDNASTDGTKEVLAGEGLLDDPRIDYVRLPENRGGAGGYAEAVDRARATGADWVWIMDDDAEVPAESLEQLLASPPAGEADTVALCQRVVNPDGSMQLGARGHLRGRPAPVGPEAYADGTYAELGFATFVGILVRGDVARAIDPPKAEFFIWADDHEYCLRLARHGRLRLVPESRIVHKDAGHGFQTRRSRLLNRILPFEFGATPYSGFWRNICGVRNFVWIRKTYDGESALGAVRTVAQFIVKALMYDEKPLRRVPWIIRAGIDGRLGVFKTITPQEWTERVGRGEW
jgi:GT2 family glycosyltransferase